MTSVQENIWMKYLKDMKTFVYFIIGNVHQATEDGGSQT